MPKHGGAVALRQKARAERGGVLCLLFKMGLQFCFYRVVPIVHLDLLREKPISH